MIRPVGREKPSPPDTGDDRGDERSSSGQRHPASSPMMPNTDDHSRSGFQQQPTTTTASSTTTVDCTATHNSQLATLSLCHSPNRRTTTVVVPVLVHKPRRTKPIASAADAAAVHTTSTCHSIPCLYFHISSFTLRSAVCFLHSLYPLTLHDHDYTIHATKNSYSQTLLSSLVLLRFLLRWTTAS
jgi:hypothetical protein